MNPFIVFVITVFTMTLKLYAQDSIVYNGPKHIVITEKGKAFIFTSTLDSAAGLESLTTNLEKQLRKVQNVGYPFARYSIEPTQSLTIDTVFVTINYEKGKQFKFDSLIIISSTKQSKTFFTNYLGIREGRVFNQSKIEKIQTRIEQLNFVRLKEQPSVSFSTQYTRIYLPLERVKINQLDAIASLQQNNNGETFINGQAKFKLFNVLGKAEIIDFNWQRASLYTQKADFQFDQPFLFNLPIGLTLKANFNRIDSAESLQGFSIGGLYYFEGNNTLKLSYFSNSRELKNFADSTALLTKTNGFRAELQMNHVNYFYSPTKGYRIHAEINSGERQQSNLKNSISTFSTNAEYYYKIKGDLIAKGGVNTLSTISKTGAVADYILIGGLNTLRGFNTNSIKTISYYQLVLEPRLIIADNSFIFVFHESSFIQIPMDDTFQNEYIIAFGGGLNIDTQGGILNLTWAIANGLGTNFKLDNSKIHIGYTLLF